MTTRIADDFPAIKARLDEIDGEKLAAMGAPVIRVVTVTETQSGCWDPQLCGEESDGYMG